MPATIQKLMNFKMVGQTAEPTSPETQDQFIRLQKAIGAAAKRRGVSDAAWREDGYIGAVTANVAVKVLASLTPAQYAKLPEGLREFYKYATQDNVKAQPQLISGALAAGAAYLTDGFKKVPGRTPWAIYIGGGLVAALGAWLLLRKKG